jgi:hypothetical protein
MLPVKRVSRVVLGAGLAWLLARLGVRGAQWLKGELAYRRWRRMRTPHRQNV